MNGKSYTDTNRNDFECGKFKEIRAGEVRSGEKEKHDVICGASIISDR